jgi:hypothetical protein
MAWKRAYSLWVKGLNSAWKLTMTIWARLLSWKLEAERALPASVRNPAVLAALARLAARAVGVMVLLGFSGVAVWVMVGA